MLLLYLLLLTADPQIGFVASFASKLSDTVSSEIGKVRLAGYTFQHLLQFLLMYWGISWWH